MPSTTLLIPAYNPDNALTNLIHQIIKESAFDILIVDDGSTNEYDFNSLISDARVQLIKHESNRGKGRALKTGLQEISKQKNIEFVVTVDADGQHVLSDIKECIRNANSESIVLGIRNFTENVPLKSLFGNQVTKFIFNKITKSNIGDTQTGLRVLPKKYFEPLLSVSGERYEYETNMLLHLVKNKIDIKQVSIKTIYIEENSSSHFKPFFDSLSVFSSLLKFASVGIISFFIDIFMFKLMILNGFNIYQSTYIARSISLTFNFFGNRRFTFHKKHEKSPLNHGFQYLLLVLLIATLSGSFVVYLETRINMDLMLIKLIVDSCLFFLSFAVQRNIIFSR